MKSKFLVTNRRVKSRAQSKLRLPVAPPGRPLMGKKDFNRAVDTRELRRMLKKEGI